MSFITDIIKFGLGQFGVEASGDTPQALAQSAITNFVTTKVNSALKINQTPSGDAQSLPPEVQTVIETVEREVKVEFKADTNKSIPVVYGDAWVDPILVDAVLTNNNCTMWYCVALCEMTGDILSLETPLATTPSQIQFKEIIINERRAVFQSDGVTVDYLSGQGETDTTVRGRIQIYPYAGNSNTPVPHILQFDTATHGPANNYMPNWTTSHAMSDLVFALIKVDYDSVNDIKGINSIKFHLENTMHWPGDVFYDYMTDTTYGAGLDTTEIEQ